MENTQSLFLQTNLTPYQPIEEQLNPCQDKYALIPSEERLKAFAITKDEFEAIINYVHKMDPISKNTIIKKSVSGLAFTIGCVPGVNEVSVNILFKKQRLVPQGTGGNCSITLGWSVRDNREISFRSAKAENISAQEREINCVLASRKDLFVVGDEIFDYRGPCSKKGKPGAASFSLNEKGEYVPARRESALPQIDKTNDNRPVFDKTGVILERMDGCVPLFIRQLTPENLFYIVREVLKGLFVLHKEYNVVHLDIKPDNILLKGQTVKIADFGHSKFHGKLINHLFTYYFQSPEIIKLGKQNLLKDCVADYPMDMWSLGVSIVNMLCLADQNNHKIWTFDWDILCRKMHSKIDTYDFSELIKGFLSKLKDKIEEGGGRDYLKIFPLLEKCLQADPAMRITAAEALKLVEELG